MKDPAACCGVSLKEGYLLQNEASFGELTPKGIRNRQSRHMELKHEAFHSFLCYWNPVDD